MKAVVQRVSKAKVTIAGKVNGEIEKGILVLLGIAAGDDASVIEKMCRKLANLRIFPDEQDKMNLSVSDINGEILVISNFTLYADAKKGYRPSYVAAAAPELAEPIYDDFLNFFKSNYSLKIEQGVFGAMMDVELVNDGPVTIIIDMDAQ